MELSETAAKAVSASMRGDGPNAGGAYSFGVITRAVKPMATNIS
jgi:hypothetical protein